ncbi:MAG: aspartate aminotransferase family protein [Clostridiaceae bacterium]|nr:aspartate aminotransferase family protein [Clostridiaceae bacterium]
MKNSLLTNYSYLSPVICKGQGVYLYDTDGKEYLDFSSGIGVNSLGYNHPKWTNATTNQIKTLQHSSNIFVNNVTADLSNKITKLSGMDKVFFANSGAEANECAFKLARKYSFDKYGKGRDVILSLKKSFHGRTLATLKSTGQEKFHNYFFPFPESFDYVESNNIEDFKSKATNKVCAIIMEAIQGESGVNPLDTKFVQQVAEICKQKDILLIFDEVQCGIARSGKLFAYNYFDIDADIVTCAKGLGAGLPIGAVLCSKKVSAVFNPGDHGSTFGGNPVACSGASVVLDELCNEETYSRVVKTGSLITTKIKNANLKNVVDVRGKGLMIGIEVKSSPSDIQKAALEKGLIVLTAGSNVVRLLPPLVLSLEDAEKGADILIDVLNR